MSREWTPKFSFPQDSEAKLKKPTAYAMSFFNWLRIPELSTHILSS